MMPIDCLPTWKGPPVTNDSTPPDTPKPLAPGYYLAHGNTAGHHPGMVELCTACGQAPYWRDSIGMRMSGTPGDYGYTIAPIADLLAAHKRLAEVEAQLAELMAAVLAFRKADLAIDAKDSTLRIKDRLVLTTAKLDDLRALADRLQAPTADEKAHTMTDTNDRCASCDIPLLQPHGFYGTDLCGPCCTGESAMAGYVSWECGACHICVEIPLHQAAEPCGTCDRPMGLSTKGKP